MESLGLDYLDLYLIHVPAVEFLDKNWKETNHSTWRAFEQLYKEGRIKAIGISNFLPHHIQALMDMAEVIPMVNQIEVHPGFNSAETVDFCRKHNIIVEAWGPFGNGQVLTNEQLKSIAAGYGKSVAQICLRWLIQKGIVPLPKSYNKERIIENIKIFDFELTETDMNRIDNIADCGGFCVNPDTASAD
jgi:diketogulonate reductase-like aldo/keto reductase